MAVWCSGKVCSIIVGLSIAGSMAHAQDLVYEPVNPSFGGNPFNSAHLLGIATAQDDNEPPVDEVAETTQAELFLRQLESRLLSGLAREVTDAIFGDDPQESGVVQFGEQSISFERGLDNVTIEVFDATTGQMTEIVLPIFSAN
ncbi:MAG: curli assembly protein CsgF [Pseudomonadota bacterium]